MVRIARLLVLLLALVSPALAQQESRPGVTAFPASFFGGNQPATALEMVALLPGFTLQTGDSDLRGYSGATGNVLIDGQRPASKEESVEDILRRIPVSAVDHIDLIRSGVPGFDMQGFTLLANVVRNRSASLSGRMDAEYNHYRRGPDDWRLGGQISYADADRTLDIAAAIWRDMDDNALGFRDRFDATGAPLRLAGYTRLQGDDVQNVSVNYTQNLLGGILRTGGLYRNGRGFDITEDLVTNPQPFQLSGDERSRDRTIEGRAEYQRPIGTNDRIELLAVHRALRQAREERTSAPGQHNAARQTGDGSETILRAVYRRQDGPLSLEAGTEAARNVLDSHSALELNGVPVPLPAANVKVEEERAEFFTVGTWRVAPAFTGEVGLRYESSTLVQSGDSNFSRPLSFLKPRLLLTWTPQARRQMRLLAERRVGQLDFDNFVSSTSLNNNSVIAGNRNLVPERQWRVELAWEQGFWERSSLVLSARRLFLTAVVDHVPVFAGGQWFNAVGNVSSGLRDELNAILNIRLDRMGLEGVTVQAEGTLRRSRVTDPVTGLRRRISGDLPVEGQVSISHDLPELKMRWGGSMSPAAQENEYRVNELGFQHFAWTLDSFIEYKPTPDWVFRLVGRNLTAAGNSRARHFYNGLRISAPLAYDEYRYLNSGPNVGIRVQRLF